MTAASPAHASVTAPVSAAALKARIQAHLDASEWNAALALALELLAADPAHDDAWAVLMKITPQTTREIYTLPLEKRMERILLSVPSTPHAAALVALHVACMRYPVVLAYLKLAQHAVHRLREEAVGALLGALDIPLLHILLRRYIVPHAGLEQLLTSLRARLLLEDIAPDAMPHAAAWLGTLAVQGHINGYVYYPSPQEAARRDALRQAALAGSMGSQEYLRLIGYCSPVELPPCPAPLPADMAGFVAQLHGEHAEEQRLVAQIPVLEMSGDAVSAAVQAQYEAHPYPRWLHLSDIPAETPAQLMKRLFPRFDLSVLALAECPEVLIAGCGTGKQALEAARRWSHGRVTAIDLSRASLAYAMRKTQEYEIKNIDYYQSDILRLGNSGHQYDLVESCGVLHHLRDPLAGWQALVRVLRPGGLMKIALYSATARASITRCRAEIQALGYSDGENDIRSFRRHILMQEAAVARYPFMAASDFYSLPECRDLLFHRQEHVTGLPEIEGKLRDLGLHFIGFDLPNAQMAQRYLKQFPQDSRMNSLSNWHALEQDIPLLFFGMYQFWCYKPQETA